MTTREWHEADQDDADRVRSWPAQDAQEPVRTAEEIEEGNWFLADQNYRLMEQLSAETARCIRLATGSEYLRAEIVNLKAVVDEAATEIVRLQALDHDHEYSRNWPLP
jgi:hypothetical protein